MRRTPPTENIPLIRLPLWVHRQGSAPGSAAVSHPMVDPRTLFTKDYLLNNLVGLHVTGADTKALGNAMRQFAADPAHASAQLITEMARLRGRDPQEFAAEYKQFQQRLAEQIQPYTGLNETLHPTFMGSETQLRYGFLVGQVLGMDPVFGAMLNPTGGIVGPDNKGLDLDSSAVGYHGITHDAAGYLLNNHGIGPGYDYLGRERAQGGFGVSTASPFTGQREGIRFWREETPVPQDFEARGQAAVDAGFRGVQIASGAWDVGSRVVEGVQHTAAEVAADVREGARVVGETAADVGRWLAHSVVARDMAYPWIM